MKSRTVNNSRLLALSTSVLGIFALFSQFYLLIQNGKRTLLEAGIRYFSFFSIQVTIIVTLCSIILFLKPPTKIGKFVLQPTTVTAVAVYITFVVLVYNVMLRHLWNPEGLQKIVDELFHMVIPILFVLYWFVNTSKAELKWSNVFFWLIYPLVYTLIIFLLGGLSDYYPYPFLNANELGYKKPIIITSILFLLLLIISLLFVGIGKILIKKNRG